MLVLRTKRQKIEQLAFAPEGEGFAAVGSSCAFWWPTLSSSRGNQLEENTQSIGFDPTGEYLVVSTPTTATLHHLIKRTTDQFLRMHSGVRVSASPTEPLFVMSTQVTSPVEGWRINSNGVIAQAWSVSPT